jgi:purine-binding chemotaxis protein CheW
MEELFKVIVFQLKNEQYGVNIQQVRSIERLQNVTEVPRTADFIKGVINLRGEITPILDLKERLNVGETEYTDETRVLIVSINTIQVGLIVDSATDVINLNSATIDPPPKMIGGITEDFLTGVAKLEDNLLILLDLERVLNLNEINEIKEVAEE